MNSKLKGVELPFELKERIIGMRLAGVQNMKIAMMLNVSESTASKVWKRYKDRGTTSNAKQNGRPKKLTDRDNRSLLHIIRRNRRFNLMEIKSQMVSSVSICTVRRALHEMGIFNRIAPKKAIFIIETYFFKTTMGQREKKLEFRRMEKGDMDR